MVQSQSSKIIRYAYSSNKHLRHEIKKYTPFAIALKISNI